MKKNSKSNAQQSTVSKKAGRNSRQACEPSQTAAPASEEGQCEGGVCAVSWKPKRTAA